MSRAAYVNTDDMGLVHLPQLEVYEPEEDLVDTGLLFPNGKRVMRREVREKLGFFAFDETGKPQVKPLGDDTP